MNFRQVRTVSTSVMNVIVGYGASTMAGSGDSQGGFFKRVEQLYKQWHPQTQFVNLGVGGNTTRDMLERLAAVESIPTYDLIVLLGCNDLPRDNDQFASTRTTLPEYSANLQALLPKIRGKRSLFISSFSVSSEQTGVKKMDFDSYVTAAVQIAGENGYSIWDLYHESQDVVAKYWAADGLHFNDAGHQLIATGAMRWLTRHNVALSS